MELGRLKKRVVAYEGMESLNLDKSSTVKEERDFKISKHKGREYMRKSQEHVKSPLS